MHAHNTKKAGIEPRLIALAGILGGCLLSMSAQADRLSLTGLKGEIDTNAAAIEKHEGRIETLESGTQGTYTRDGVPGSYAVSNERYVVESSPLTVGIVQPLDHEIVTRLCQDLDGCDFTLAMINWDNNHTVASRHARLFLGASPDSSGGIWWRLSDFDVQGTDGSNTLLSEYFAWDCGFTEAETSTNAFNGRSDDGPGFGLLNARGGSYSDSITVCRIILQD